MGKVSGLLGRKVGMTTIFTEEGKQIPVTVIQAGPCAVVQIKNRETDGYEAVQLGFERYPERRVHTGGGIPRGKPGHRAKGKPTAPLAGHFKKHGLPPMKHLAEFAYAHGAELQVGEEITVDIFKPGDKVKVAGTSKGRGFSGVMRRHNFSGQGASHGAKIHRKPASVGATDPARVFKGKRMPGHYGNARVTVKGLKVVDVDVQRNLLLVQGAVPGARGGLLRIETNSGTCA